MIEGEKVPEVIISVRKRYSSPEKNALVTAVHSAIVETLRIPDHDKLIKFHRYKKDEFIVPPGGTDDYIVIEIFMFSGRSLDTKRVLYKSIVRNLGQLGIEAHDIRIVLLEVPRENWGIRGGVPASEVELGFDVEI